MRKLSVPLIIGSTLALGACATNPYGGGMGGGPLEAILGSVLGAGQQGYGQQGYGQSSFQQAAVNACARAASRYGQVSIRNVRQVSRSTLRVYGMVGSRYGGGRNFACSFRSDGRITDFDI
jgi:hypothetical protein